MLWLLCSRSQYKELSKKENVSERRLWWGSSNWLTMASKSEQERSDGKSDSKVETKRVDNGSTNLDDLSCNLSECNGNFMSMSIVSLVLSHKDRPEGKIKVIAVKELS